MTTHKHNSFSLRIQLVQVITCRIYCKLTIFDKFLIKVFLSVQQVMTRLTVKIVNTEIMTQGYTVGQNYSSRGQSVLLRSPLHAFFPQNTCFVLFTFLLKQKRTTQLVLQVLDQIRYPLVYSHNIVPIEGVFKTEMQ